MNEIDSHQIRTPRERRRSALPGRFVIAAIAVLVGLFAAEGLSRVAWKWLYNRQLEELLGGYQFVDKANSIILLNPNTRLTLRQLFTRLESHDKTRGADALRLDAAQVGAKDDEIVFSINRFGFIGPEINKEKTAGYTRIMTIGDSVTFGSYVNNTSYPRVLEQELNRRSDHPLGSVEVINAAVQGYNIEGVLKRIDYFLDFDPDLITILIGWNRTIIRADPDKQEALYRNLTLYRFFYHGLIARQTSSMALADFKKMHFDPADPLMNRLRIEDFAYDLKDLDTLIKRVRELRPKAKICLLTLAGLFVENVTPTADAIQKAYPTSFTPNLSAWAVLCSGFNQKLREFAASRGIEVIDMADWSVTAFVPRERYFVDSVHMSAEGSILYGKRLAEEIVLRAPSMFQSGSSPPPSHPASPAVGAGK